ncbi:MAG TPA: CBS and ACT domain-containing protein [Anaerolineales bacterium]|nr:CBS and ACT domain-containing protein [Anaerolineales bacterium]
MLVGEHMKYPVITVAPNVPIIDALNTMKSKHIQRMPVVDKAGKLVGIVSSEDLLNASPSKATSLSVWELNYLISKITVKDVMTKEVLTVTDNTPIEEAARVMVDNKVGGLPVMHEQKLVGIITETDLFKIFLKLLGEDEPGLRVTVVVPNRPGELAKLTHAITSIGGDFLAFGAFPGEVDTERSEVVFKVTGLDEQKIRTALAPVVEKITDIRGR